MCGICGFNWENKLLIKSMVKSIEHRGPDNSGIYLDKNISLGHQRLSIIDTSIRGTQPMSNNNGSIIITFNGEIYNYKEIKTILEKKYEFKTETDTEVIIYAYEEWGVNCLSKLNGMFAFAIWDSNKKQIFVARDRIGIKPLYYYYDKEKFIFSSEIKALIEHEIPRVFNRDSLDQLLIYSYPMNNETLLKNVFELPPGSYLIFKNNNIIINKYWNIQMKIENKSLNYYTKRLEEELFSSVSRRLISDVPLGASLSGGLDSSIIVAIMNKLKKDQIKTFTIGFGDQSDELKKAKIVAEHCNTNHQEIFVDFDEISSSFTKILWHLETPFGRPAVLPTYFLAKETKKKVTVSLVGEGSDEIFAGYDRYYPYAKKPRFSPRFFFKKEYLNHYKNFSKYVNCSLDEKAKNICSGNFIDHVDSAFLKSSNDITKKNEESINSFKQSLQNSPKDEGINSALLFEIKNELPGIQLNRVDRMSMAHAVEMRVPFLDHNLVEFAMTIPSKYKWKGPHKKYILQKVASKFLPKEIANRKKMPFHVPLGEYFKKNFISYSENILLNSKNKRKFINYDYYSKLIDKIKREDNITNNQLRQILFTTSLEIWYRLFIEKENQADIENI
ncbi:MAG: asparagine synthase (glutamine-hydrolyzing) [Lutibacter sp.]|nr:asparagine synthase (glutamine-hydrolyzing) [Lutibacter sp.]